MSYKNNKKRRLFINTIRGKNGEFHKIIINERIFNLNDINKWKLYVKLFLQHFNYICEINKQQIDVYLQEIIQKVNEEAKQFKTRMGYILGDWRYII